MKNIIFDLGGVLIDWNPRYLFQKIFKSEQQMQHFLTEVCNQEWNEQQDAGRSFKDAVEERVQKFPDYEEAIRAYHIRWDEMIGGSIQGTVDILEKIHHSRQHNLFALTNWSAETFPIAKKKFPFLKLFQGITVSGEINIKKPDPRIYRHLLENFNLKAEECLFIDDVEKNIQAAQRLGIKSIHFQDPKHLIAELKNFRVKIH